MKTYTVIIPAAGQGKRMQTGKNKQFLQINTLPLIIHTVEIFQKDEACAQMIVVANSDEVAEMKQLFARFGMTKVKAVVPGGDERQGSVYAGLQEVEREDGIVMVHDGARPFVRHREIHRLLREVTDTEGAVLATRVKDTIKKSSAEQVVTETLKREELWTVQTPQAFTVRLLKKAYEYAEKTAFAGTDDASLVERIDGRIRLVEGLEENIKLTTPYDIGIAELIIERRKEDRRENRARI